MAQRIKWIDAGPLHLGVLYPQLSGWDSERVRGEKRKATNAARKALNKTWSSRRLAFLMALNFSPGEHSILFTFDDEHLPPDRAGVLRAFRNFLDRLQRLRSKRGAPLRVLYRDEHKHGDGRWHIHALINDAGDLGDIRRLWGRGRVLEIPFQMRAQKNALTLAHYWTKEKRDRVGQKAWYKRGPIRTDYEVQSWAAPDDYALELPAGALKLEWDEHSDEYGKHQLLFYMDSGAGKRRRRRPPPKKKQSRKS